MVGNLGKERWKFYNQTGVLPFRIKVCKFLCPHRAFLIRKLVLPTINLCFSKQIFYMYTYTNSGRLSFASTTSIFTIAIEFLASSSSFPNPDAHIESETVRGLTINLSLGSQIAVAVCVRRQCEQAYRQTDRQLVSWGVWSVKKQRVCDCLCQVWIALSCPSACHSDFCLSVCLLVRPFYLLTDCMSVCLSAFH